MRKHVLFTVLKAYLLVGFLTGCSFTEKAEVQSLYGYSMGTSYHIKLVTPLSKAQRLQLGIEGILADVNARMSTYLTSSDLSKFKGSATNEPVTVSERTISVVQRALEISAITQGYFDPTIAPLVDLWGFGPSAKVSEQPSLSQIQQLLPFIGYRQVIVDTSKKTISKSAQTELDLSAIAKGYAVDLVAEYLISKDISNFLVEIGGEMRSSGVKPTGELWRIAIEAPYINEQRVYEILELDGMAIATSGDYRNYFESEGIRYSHTINPKT
ncbi:FAD:protein FMN transferase, partial [Reinekea sp.]